MTCGGSKSSAGDSGPAGRPDQPPTFAATTIAAMSKVRFGLQLGDTIDLD